MTATASAAPGRGSTMSIGQVLSSLREDFPDVTISKIRFLEAEGLVEPQRAPSGYRRFTHDDVERLRYVLGAQRDHYLPLKVIREHLDAIDRGLRPAAPLGRPGVPREVGAVEGPRADELVRDGADVTLTRAELVESAGTTERQLASLEQHGLVQPRPSGHYDADALAVARICVELGQFGLEPRHLRGFRTAADREIDLVDQAVGPLQRMRSDDAASRAEEAAREIAALSLQLRTALVRAGVRRVLHR
jgi:DNA-binding transcriptional MerR regulator